MPAAKLAYCPRRKVVNVHTVLEVHCNVIAADVRGHGNDWCVVELSDQMASRDTIKVGHDDVHQHKIVLCAGIHLVDRFQSVKLG